MRRITVFEHEGLAARMAAGRAREGELLFGRYTYERVVTGTLTGLPWADRVAVLASCEPVR